MNVVVRSEDGAVSLLVDEIGDVVEVDEDQLRTAPGNLARLGPDHDRRECTN
jgi:purine-binding chemotaxis protein CheW